MTSLVIALARRVFCCSDFPGHNFTITWGILFYLIMLGLALPSVSFGCFAAWAGPHLIELAKRVFGERYVQCAQTPRQLLYSAWADDRSRDGGIVQQPSQRNVRRVFTKLLAQSLVGLQLRAMLLDLLLNS